MMRIGRRNGILAVLGLAALLGTAFAFAPPTSPTTVEAAAARAAAAAVVTASVGPAVPQPLVASSIDLASASPPTTDSVDVATADPIVTGSVGSTAALADADAAIGTPAFRAALALIDDKDYAEAYEAARALPDNMERRTIQWAAIQYGSGAIDYASIQRFSNDAPDFANASLFKTRLEQSLTRSGPGNAEVIGLLGGEEPTTIEARIALASAYLADGQKAQATKLARALWVEEFLSAPTEKRVLDKLGELLTRKDHWDRAVHLMMNDRASGVERLMKFMTPGQKSLAVARNAVSRKAKNAKALLDKVDPDYQTNPVYIFSRVQRARQAGLLDSAVEWLDKATGPLPDAEDWWYERRSIVRQLLADGDAKLAYRAADGYTDGPEGRLVEAHFHAGWIALAFLNDAASARTHFEAMSKVSTLPDSVTQAQYWLGRALIKLGDKDAAKAAFTTASSHGTTYYGLLARNELGLAGAGLRDMPKWRDSEAAFDARDVVRAVRLLAANDKISMAEPLLRTYASNLTSGPELLLAARLAQSINAHHLAIAIADIAEKQGTPLDLFSFPKDGLPNAALAAIDKAAVYAITRQESRFQPGAVSSAGALGLMQLMPETAKETAAKVGVSYSRSRLTDDPAYNALLGSTYLAAQLSRYEGSLVLAAAAYNAGAGNANKWIKAYGDPRQDNVDPVIWVELIPFQETRKYVQRVLANYLVYRTRLGDDQMTIAQALRRIPD